MIQVTYASTRVTRARGQEGGEAFCCRVWSLEEESSRFVTRLLRCKKTDLTSRCIFDDAACVNFQLLNCTSGELFFTVLSV